MIGVTPHSSEWGFFLKRYPYSPSYPTLSGSSIHKKAGRTRTTGTSLLETLLGRDGSRLFLADGAGAELLEDIQPTVAVRTVDPWGVRFLVDAPEIVGETTVAV